MEQFVDPAGRPIRSRSTYLTQALGGITLVDARGRSRMRVPRFNYNYPEKCGCGLWFDYTSLTRKLCPKCRAKE